MTVNGVRDGGGRAVVIAARAAFSETAGEATAIRSTAHNQNE